MIPKSNATPINVSFNATGLAAGTYALLPAHYALLPGAFALWPVVLARWRKSRGIR